MTMRPPVHPRRFAAAAALLVLAGCFKLSRDTPRVQYFVLNGAAPSAVASDTVTGEASGPPATSPGPGVAVGLRRIDLAAYLAVPSIVLRRGTNQLVVSEFHRWGEDLGEGINRVVAARLADTPPVRAVDVAPWAARARHDYLLQLHVSRFEGVADSAAAEGRSHLVAGWDIIRPVDGRVLVRGSTEALEGTWRVSDYAGLVSSLDAALARLARDIGRCLARFPNDSTPPARCDSGTGERPDQP
jgi:uncharacterized lipoprotein YmbA